MIYWYKGAKGIVLPESYIENLMFFIHEELCHLGSEKLEDYLKRMYF